MDMTVACGSSRQGRTCLAHSWTAAVHFETLTGAAEGRSYRMWSMLDVPGDQIGGLAEVRRQTQLWRMIVFCGSYRSYR